MKFEIKDEVNEYNPKNEYLLKIKTMTGDTDDYHTISKHFKDENELKQAIIYCEVLKKQFPYGMTGSSDYDHLEFFIKEELFEEWFYDNNYEKPDQFSYYKVYYFDDKGNKFEVKVELNENDKKEIKKHPVKE